MDPASHGLNLFALIQPYLQEAIGLAISVLMAYGLALLRKHVGLQVSAGARDAISAAVTRKALAELRRHAPELRSMLTVPASHPAVAAVADYAETQLPATLKSLGMDAPAVRAMAQAEIARLLGISPEDMPSPATVSEDEMRKKVLAEILEKLQTPQKEPSP